MAATTPTPTTAERRKRLKSARRESILAAARKVFAREGFEGTTIADVAREAGVAAGTVYLYYPSKLEIFAALKELFFDVIYAAIRDAPAPPDVRGGTRARIHAVFEACSEHRDLVHLVFLNPDPRTEAARKMQRADEQRLRPLAQLLEGGMEAGAVRRTDPVSLARLITGVVTVALYQCFLQSDSPDVEGYEDIVTEMIVGGLTPP